MRSVRRSGKEENSVRSNRGKVAENLEQSFAERMAKAKSFSKPSRLLNIDQTRAVGEGG